MTDLQKDIRSIYIMAPIWMPKVWQAIQDKNYKDVELQLASFLENEIESDEWTDIYWHGILSGIPMFRESINKDEWEKDVLPAIARAVRRASSDEILQTIYSSLQKDDLKKFRALMLKVTAEEDVKKHTATNTPQTEQQVVFSPPPSQDVPLENTPAPPEQTEPQPQPQTIPPAQPVVAQKDEANLLSPGFRGQPVAPQSPKQNKQAATPTQPAPFVLHKEAEIQPLASGGMAPLSRPQFFKSTSEKKPPRTPSTARLEIGGSETAEAKKTGQTKKEIPKVVNYTGPVTQVDPFKRSTEKKEGKPEAEQALPKEQLPILSPTKSEKQNRGSSISKPNQKTDLEEIGTKEVSPDNIVNLKDLPK